MGDLTTALPPTWTRQPPGMAYGDYRVWQRYLQAEGAQYDSIAYDVELHAGATPVTDEDPAIARMAARLSARRVDAIGIQPDGVTLIEAKIRASAGAIGQLQVYAWLWPQNYPDTPIVRKLIVTDIMEPAARAAALAMGIDVWEIPRDAA